MLTIHLSIVIFMPLAAGFVGLFLRPSWARWAVLAATVGVLAYAVVMLTDFDRHAVPLQYVTNDSWISELGIRYSLGVDGLNLWLIALTAALWVPSTVIAVKREWDRPRLFFFMLGLAETAV